MAFGGHHAKAASDQLQKKLQEDMGDADKLAARMAGMDVKDPKGDDISMGSSNAEAELELLRAQTRQLQGQLNIMAMTNATLTGQLAETSAAVSLEQMKHNKIIASDFFTSAIAGMKGPDCDIDTLWWVVQWGNEYLARFNHDPSIPLARKKAHKAYKDWTANNKMKQAAGFYASKGGKTGDDSFQSP